jgi:hypothetical protein
MIQRDERRFANMRAGLLQLLQVLPDQPGRLRDTLVAVTSGADRIAWQDLIDAASYHGVLNVLDWRLVPDADVPRAAQAAARQRLAVQQIWHGHLMSGLCTAVSALAAAGVRVCAVKGPVLAERLYPVPEARHCLDLDLLVRPEDFDHAVETLTHVGYRTGDPLTSDYLRRYSHHLEFSGAGLPPLELHFRTYAGFGAELPAGVLFDRAEPFRLSKTISVLTPSPEDEFLYLSVHAAGHSFIRLVWLYDLKLLILRHPSLDWDRVARTAATYGVTGPLAYATRLLQLWLGMPLGDLPPGLQRRNLRARMADWLLDEVSAPQPKSVRDNLGGLLFTSLLCDRVRSGGWLIQHHVLRSARRRLRQMAPSVLPERWSS